MSKQITVDGLQIGLVQSGEADFVNITDIARRRNENKPSDTIAMWLRNVQTLLYLEAWEELINPIFQTRTNERVSAVGPNQPLCRHAAVSGYSAYPLRLVRTPSGENHCPHSTIAIPENHIFARRFWPTSIHSIFHQHTF